MKGTPIHSMPIYEDYLRRGLVVGSFARSQLRIRRLLQSLVVFSDVHLLVFCPSDYLNVHL